MKFEKYDIKNVGMHYKRSSNMKLLDEFKKSGLKCAKVTEWNHSKATFCSSSIQQTIKRYKEEYKDIVCILRGDEVFLINEAVEE